VCGGGGGGGGVRCGCVSSVFATDLCVCDLCNYGIHYFFGILLKFNFCHNMLSLLWVLLQHHASVLIFIIGQNQIYTVYIRLSWQENHQIYDQIRSIYIQFWPNLIMYFWHPSTCDCLCVSANARNLSRGLTEAQNGQVFTCSLAHVPPNF